jgi:hypothetical protein
VIIVTQIRIITKDDPLSFLMKEEGVGYLNAAYVALKSKLINFFALFYFAN